VFSIFLQFILILLLMSTWMLVAENFNHRSPFFHINSHFCFGFGFLRW